MSYRILSATVLHRVDPETAHALGLGVLRCAMAVPGVRHLATRLLAPREAALQVEALGLTLPSPLGLAAGFDKQASHVRELLALGFGFIEVGTVTGRGQAGNARPRIVRFPADRALMNSMGFPNDGAASVAARLRRRRTGVVGVNVGKTKSVAGAQAGEDYRASVRQMAPFADYLVLNVSSPNTPGLRSMQAADRLAALIDEVRHELASRPRRVPLLVKIAPDLRDDELDAIVDLALDRGLDGIVAVNTTTDAAAIGALARSGDAHAGGLSGAPLKARSLEVLRRIRARCGDALVLVSVGGVETPDDAWARIVAGATLVQAYSGFAYGGPLWPHRMNRGLQRRVRAAGLSSVQQAVGAGEG